jgi:predicted nucleic acid-binding protein
LGQSAVQIVVPGENHADVVFGLLEELGVAGNLTTDAHVAAMALEYGAEVATTDADFTRFPRVRWFNPVTGKRAR